MNFSGLSMAVQIDIIGWLDQNKTWVLSGIGIAVPLAVIGWLLTRASSSRRQTQRSGDGSSSFQAGGDIHISIGDTPETHVLQRPPEPAFPTPRAHKRIELVSHKSRNCIAYRRHWEDGDGISETYQKDLSKPILVTVCRLASNARIMRAQISYLDSSGKEAKVHGTWMDADYAFIEPTVGIDYELIIAGQFDVGNWRAFDDKRTKLATKRELAMRPLRLNDDGVCYAQVSTFLEDERGPEFLFVLGLGSDGCLQADFVDGSVPALLQADSAGVSTPLLESAPSVIVECKTDGSWEKLVFRNEKQKTAIKVRVVSMITTEPDGASFTHELSTIPSPIQLVRNDAPIECQLLAMDGRTRSGMPLASILSVGTESTIDTVRIEYDDADGIGYYREFALTRQITGAIFWDPGPVRLRERV